MVRQGFFALAVLGLCIVPAGARAGDVAFTVVNDSSYDVIAFFTAPVDAAQWGHNLLGGFTLRSHSQGTATIAGGSKVCVYDIKYAMSDGETYYKRQLDICRISSYRIHD